MQHKQQHKQQQSPVGDGLFDRGLEGSNDRRTFLRRAGLGGAAMFLAACNSEQMLGGLDPTYDNHAADGSVVLDFSTDTGVLNYAYALEQLEAAFYTQVVATAGFATRFAANEQRVLVDLRDHEIVHREFLKTALGAAAIPALTVDFSMIDFTSRSSVLMTARTFEDLGVGAYNGAGKYLQSNALLTVAGKIVSVEARHAAAIRDILENRTSAFAPQAFDPALAPSAVLAAADPFIVNAITVTNA